MFDKLIESDSEGADFKDRRRYFLTSSIIVGILFLGAVIFSIYAAEIDLGNDEFELSTLLAPTVPNAPPTSGAITRRRVSGIPSVSESSSRTRCGICVDVYRTYESVPAAYSATTARGSIALGMSR